MKEHRQFNRSRSRYLTSSSYSCCLLDSNRPVYTRRSYSSLLACIQVEMAVEKDEARRTVSGGAQDTIHTICTSNGSPYLNFQNRIM